VNGKGPLATTDLRPTMNRVPQSATGGQCRPAAGRRCCHVPGRVRRPDLAPGFPELECICLGTRDV